MSGKARVLGLIPARGGSKRVPRKNLQKLGGRSLLEIAISQALECPLVDVVAVSSEDEEILDHARAAGAETFLRPPELAQDDTPGIAPVIHALEHEAQDCTEVALLQPTSPFRSSADIEAAIRLRRTRGAPSCVSVTEAHDNPAWMFLIDAEGRMQPFLEAPMPSRSQELPPVHVLNGAVYVATRECILKNRGFFTEDTVAHVMPPERSLDIDTPWDLRLARALLAAQADAEKD